MGQPTSQNPFSPDSTPRHSFPSTQERPSSLFEKREVPKKPRASIADYEARAKKVESEPNKEAADAIRRLDGSKATAEQLDGLTALNIAIVSVLTKLAKKGVDISKITSTEQLKREVAINGLQLSLPEAAAVENLDRIAGESGETADEIKKSWPERISAAQEGSKGYGAKYMDYLRTNPVGTIALTVAGIAGIILTYQGIKAVAGATFSKAGKESKNTSWFNKEVAIPLVIMTAGAFLGKDVVAKMLSEAGLDYFGVEEKVKKGKAFTAEEKKKLTAAGEKIEEKIEEEKAKKDEKAVSAEPAKAEATPVTENPSDAEGKPGPLRTKAEAESKNKETNEKAKEELEYEAARDLLVIIACYEKGIGEVDQNRIRRSIDKIRDKKISEILAFWSQHKDKEDKSKADRIIPKENSLAKFDDDIEEKNIYRAVRIVARTAEEYQSRSKTDISGLTLKEFLIKHIKDDGITKIGQQIQESFRVTIEKGEITDLAKLNDINFSEIDEKLKEMGENSWKELAADFGIDLKEVKGKDFVLMLRHAMSNAELTQSAEAVFQSAGFPKSTDQKTNEAFATFYEKTREKTLKTIFPAAIERFNLDAKAVRNPDKNADILKKNLNENIKFKRALYLCAVTRSIDLSKSAKEGSTPPQEFAFLFTILSSIKATERRKYMSELIVALDKMIDKLPSLEMLKPYISTVTDLAIDHVARKLDAYTDWASALMPNRTFASRQEFFEEMRKSPWGQWASEGAKEATGGSLSLFLEVIEPLKKAGITLAEIGQCETKWDCMMLIAKAGGSILYHEDEKGRPHGAVYLLGDIFVFRPAGMMWEVFKAAKDGDAGGMFKVWTVASAPFVAYGALHGGIKAYWANGGWQTGRQLYGVASGGLKMGLGYPYYAGKQTVRAAVSAPTAIAEYGWRRPIGTLGRVGRGTADVIRYRSLWPGQNVPNMLNNGKWFEHYAANSDLTKLSLKEKFHYATHEPKVLLSRLGKGFNTSMTLRYASRFASDYNNFFDFDRASSQRLNLVEILEGNDGAIGEVRDRHFRIRTFLEGVESYDPIFEKMRETIKTKMKGSQLRDALTDEIMKMKGAKGGLKIDEARYLAKQLLSEKDVNNLQGRMKLGLNAMKKATATAAENAAEAEKPGRWERFKRRFRRTPDKGEGASETAEGAKESPKPTPGSESAKPEKLGPGKNGNRYRYKGEEYEFSQNEIRKAASKMNISKEKALAALCEERYAAAHPTQKASAPEAGAEGPKVPQVWENLTKPADLGHGKFRYMGEEFSLTEAEINGTVTATVTREQAVEKLCEQKWSEPHFVSEGPKGRVFRLRGGEFTIASAEYAGTDLNEIAKICEAKYARSIAITEGRIVGDAAYFKIGGENGKWVKAPEGGDALAKLRADFVEEAKKANVKFDYTKLADSKLLKYFGVLKESVGPAMAVIMIYQMETAQDKRKVIAETAIVLGSFWTGTKLAEKGLRRWTPKSVTEALGKGGIILVTGLITALGVTEPVSSILEDLIPKFAGDQQISLEMISLFEKYTARGFALGAIRKAETILARNVVEKKGLQAIGKLLGKKVESTVLKKVATFASKPLIEKVAAGLGLRGVVVAGLLADDATLIGVLDDVIAVGMAAWMAKDIYDIAVLARRSLKIKSAMEEYNKMPIADVKPAGIVDEKAIEAALAAKNLKMEELSDEQLMEVIKSIPDIRLKITRQGSTGYEEYRFVKGEVFSTKIKAKDGEILELSDEELNQEIAMGPPKEFNPAIWEIDYNQPKEKLEANYRMAILYTKSECGWTKLDFEITDENTIAIKRLDGGNESTNIKRSGNRWSVENYSGGHTLFQALVLANLTNKVHGILAKEKHVGGSEQPFSLDGDNIDFDKAWNPNDLRILAAETSWLAFYDKIGVSKQIVVDTLNAWYKAKYKAVADAY